MNKWFPNWHKFVDASEYCCQSCMSCELAHSKASDLFNAWSQRLSERGRILSPQVDINFQTLKRSADFSEFSYEICACNQQSSFRYFNRSSKRLSTYIVVDQGSHNSDFCQANPDCDVFRVIFHEKPNYIILSCDMLVHYSNSLSVIGVKMSDRVDKLSTERIGNSNLFQPLRKPPVCHPIS